MHALSYAYASELHLSGKVQAQPIAEGMHTCFPSSLEAVTLMPEFYAEYSKADTLPPSAISPPPAPHGESEVSETQSYQSMNA